VLDEKAKILIAACSETKSAVNEKTIDAPTSFKKHNQLVADLLDLTWDLGAVSGLWYDPKVATYHLIIASLDDAPKLIELVAQVRGMGNGVLVSGTLNEVQHKAILTNITNVNVYREALLLQLSAAANADASLLGLVQAAKEQLIAVDNFANLVDQEILSKREFTLDPKTLWSTSTAIVDGLFEFNDGAAESLQKALQSRLVTEQRNRNATLVFLVLLIVLCGYLGWVIARSLKSALTAAQHATTNIVEGNYSIALNTERHDEFGALNKAMLNMSEQLANAAKIQVENFRIKMALDNSTTAFLMCDLDGNINYANASSMRLLRNSESEIKKQFPSFSPDNMMGANIDFFHKNPSHQKNILNSITGTHVAQIKIASRIFKLIMNPYIDSNKVRMGTVVEWSDLTEEVLADQQKTRILESLDSTSTNLMIADANRNIIYMNKSVKAMLQEAEHDLRQALPNFSVNNVIGSNMDIFHKNPAHQMQLLESLKSAYIGNIVVGKRSFRLTASPISDDKGERLGTVVEWLDRTAEVAAEKDVNTLVDKAVVGDFTGRIPTEGKSGFFLTLAERLNLLMQTSDIGLGEVNRVLGAIAKGDLTEKITADYSGTFGELKDYCNSTTESLSDIIGEIRTAAETIFTASSEIASGNADLSSRTEQQAANLEETASSMEELTSTVKLNADNAKQANVLASQASTVAVSGGELIQQVVGTMSSINQSSQKIADIIGVIDGIAFQTNILALNAAVEAARAGDQGRGFAVVASEVRTLAQRSANAAKDIKGLISDSVKKIENGNTLVGKSGETMKEIVTAIKRVNDIMAEIAAASTEQSAGIEEVSTAVSQMDEMTQQNAALVEEAAAAAESLQSQADQLTQRVSQFRLASDNSRRSSAPAARLSSPTKKSAPVISKKLSPPKDQDDEWESF
jgi:methyl-accepting chemotaxis protein